MLTRAAILPALLAAASCASPTTPREDVSPDRAAATAPAAVAATAAAPVPASAAATVPAAATAPASAAAPVPATAAAPASADAPASAPEPAPALAPDNKVLPPLEGEELTARAKVLFEAIVSNDPAGADPFWFPKAPFIPLKDVKDPGKYWDQLHAAYANDVKALHRKRKSWEGAQFVGFQVGSKPKWVPPGDEVNKIGYYRSFHGKLKYEISGEAAEIDVHTIISWQGRWYITHLSKFKKKS